MNKIAFVLFALFLVAFGVMSSYYENVGPIEVRCTNDTECTFVRTECCPGCGNFRSVNHEASIYINAEFNEECKEECNATFCTDETGGLLYAVPKCVENKCGIDSKLNCEAVCKYAMYYYIEPQIGYLNKTAQRVGLKSVDELFDVCCHFTG